MVYVRQEQLPGLKQYKYSGMYTLSEPIEAIERLNEHQASTEV